MVFTPCCFAVAVSRPNESESENGVMLNTVAWRFADSNFFAAVQAHERQSVGSGWVGPISTTTTPVYSG